MRCHRLVILFFLTGQSEGFLAPLSHTRKVQSVARIAGEDIDLDSVEDIEITKEDKEFLAQCKLLSESRNLPLDNVKNARDLASTDASPIKENRLYRMGRLSDASEKDIDLLLDELNIRTIIDLRSPTELKDDATLQRYEVFGDFTDIIWSERGLGRDGCLKELTPGQSPVKKLGSSFWRRETAGPVFEDVIDVDVNDDCNACEENGGVLASNAVSPKGRKERYFVSLMNEFKYVRGTLSKVRKRDIARTVLKSPGALVSKRVRSSVKVPFLNKINDGGLPMLNELLLRFGAPGIKYVLDICADKSRHPVVFHCTAGKDRTGMITAIILSLVGVPDEEIVQDYTLSANVYAEMNDHKAMVGALSQRNLDPKTFLGAPPQVMRDTLESIREEYGSVEGYLDWIGFGPEKQEQLKKAILE